MNNRIINVMIIVATVTLLSVLAFYVKAGSTADAVAVLRTTGMTCGSCSSKITTLLETQKGVAGSEVDIEGGWVIVGYDTKSVNPEVLAGTINSIGFVSSVYRVLTPEQFKQITGRVIGRKGSPVGDCGDCGPRGGCGIKKQI